MNMNDQYSHTENSLIYITESIPGPKENSVDYEKLLNDYNSQYDACDCKQHCNDNDSCHCLQQSNGKNYERVTHADADVFRIWKADSTYPMYECTSKCLCNLSCGNRVVQKGPTNGLIVRPCVEKQKGRGLFTLHLIPRGMFICEYAGELLTKSQALMRIQENESNKFDNYVFCLNEHSAAVTQTFVDPAQFGNIGRYINHSCDPNCCVVPVRYDNLIPKLAIFACKNILQGEEITFCYGSNCQDKPVLLNTWISPKKCYCNSDKCQGYLPFSDI